MDDRRESKAAAVRDARALPPCGPVMVSRRSEQRSRCTLVELTGFASSCGANWAAISQVYHLYYWHGVIGKTYQSKAALEARIYLGLRRTWQRLPRESMACARQSMEVQPMNGAEGTSATGPLHDLSGSLGQVNVRVHHRPAAVLQSTRNIGKFRSTEGQNVSRMMHPNCIPSAAFPATFRACNIDLGH